MSKSGPTSQQAWAKQLRELLGSSASARPVAASSARAGGVKAEAAVANSVSSPRRPVTDANNRALAKMSPEELSRQDLTQRDAKGLFTDEYMSGLVGLKIPGANNNNLKAIMRKLAKGVSPGERQALINQLAAIRGVPAAKLDADYDRFLVLRTQQEAIGKQNKQEGVPDLAEDIHDTFMASNPQLVFGKVVGDAFGIDPVFGALLSPTGGMVGPGNKAVQLDDDDPTGYHGIVHDAAGYLSNYHRQGPGYDYLGKEQARGRKTEDPLTGQQSGMRYWHEKLDPGAGTVVLNGVIDVVYAHKDAYDAAKKLAGDVGKRAKAAKDAVVDTLADATESAKKVLDPAARALVKAAADAKVKADKVLDTARKNVDRALDEAMKTAGSAAKKAATALEQSALEAIDAAKAAKARAEEAAKSALAKAKSAAGGATAYAADKLNAAWDFVWN